jgi:hypothetical protein
VRGAAGAQDEQVGGAVGQGGAVGDGLRDARVVESAAGELDRRAGQQGQGSAGPQGQAQLSRVADERAQVDGVARLRVGGQRVQLDRAGQHGGEIHRERGLVQVLDQRADVGHRTAAQQRGAANQGPGVGGLGPAAQAFRPAQQPGAGDRAGRGAVDRVEGRDQAKLVQREGHARRDDAAHASALDSQGDPQPVVPGQGLAARAAAFGQGAPYLVRRGGTGERLLRFGLHCGSLSVHPGGLGPAGTG